ECVLARVRRAVAAPDVSDDLADAACRLAAERIRPEPVDDPALERLRGDDAERRSRIEGAGDLTDRDAVARRIETALGQQAEEGAIASGGGTDAKPLDGADVTPARRNVGAQDEQPRRALRQRDHELRSFPLGE